MDDAADGRPGPDGRDGADAPRGKQEARQQLQEELDEWAADVVDGGLGLARLAVGGAVRTARWSIGRSLRIAEQVVGSIASGSSVAAATARGADDARHAILEYSGLEDPAPRTAGRPTRTTGTDAGRRVTDRATAEELRRRGEALLARSADVDEEVEAHPSFARILDDLSPDEARILRLLAEAGPQPAVDVRSSSPIPGSSELVAGGLSMVGAQAGCRYLDRVRSYLNNLERLGLVWFSREEVDDPAAYQVLEAQPEVVDAMDRVRRARTVRRSIELTPFGTDFVTVCLVPDADDRAD